MSGPPWWEQAAEIPVAEVAGALGLPSAGWGWAQADPAPGARPWGPERPVGRRTARLAPATEPEPMHPPRAEVGALWGACRRLDVTAAGPDPLDLELAGWLSCERALYPPAVAALDLARVLPPPEAHPFPAWLPPSWRCRWPLALPAWTAAGDLGSLRLRTPGGAFPKERSPCGVSAKGLTLADPVALALLRGEPDPRWDGSVLVVGGSPDFLTWAIRPWEDRRPAILGTWSGAWTADLASRIPDGARVILGTDAAPAGDRMALAIQRTLYPRCRCQRAKVMTRDWNDLHRAGELPPHPSAGAEDMPPPPEDRAGHPHPVAGADGAGRGSGGDAMTPAILQAALGYSALGWPVFPLHEPHGADGCSCGKPKCHSPGKHPRTRKGHKEATTDPTTIRGWWDRWPTANIGMPTGDAIGAWVLDVDPDHQGDATLARLEAEHGPLPPTLTARTGSGGRHLLFRLPAGREVRNSQGGDRLPGLDTRGEGGYIVVAPSLHRSGQRYTWEAAEPSAPPDPSAIAEAPAWLFEVLWPPKAPPSPRPVAPSAPPLDAPPLDPAPEEAATPESARAELDRLCRSLGTVSQGGRHDAVLRAARLAGGRVAAGLLSRSEARSALEEAATRLLGPGREPEARRTVDDGLCDGERVPLTTTTRGRGEPDANDLDRITRHAGAPLALYDTTRFATWGCASVKDRPNGSSILVGRDRLKLGDIDLSAPVAGFSVGVLERLEAWTREGAGLLGSVDAARFLLWLQWKIHDLGIPRHSPVIAVHGGWDELRRRVGAAESHRSAGRLRAIVCCLDAARFPLPGGGAGRLLSLTYQEAGGPNRPAEVTITPSPPLLPGYVCHLPDGYRRVVPALRGLPPLVGRNNERGSVAQLALLIVAEMRRRCAEMVGARRGDDQGVPLAPADLSELADRVHLKREVLDAAIDRWKADGADGPAFLREVRSGRYTLGDAHQHVRDVLLHFGWAEVHSRGGGGTRSRRRPS